MSASSGYEGQICGVGGQGNFLPREYEADWPPALRGVLYLLFLIWCFKGVEVVSDIFMAAIERITSKRVRRLNKETGRHTTVLVWNPTVANLSLLALGSSAPEILLNVIDIFSKEFFAGDLGPSTIVGSAAFNLLCIVAVCISAIPDGECRKIKEMPVHIVQAVFSIFAYLWLLIILMASSPEVVEVWEGVLTFLFFPLLLVLAYMADRGMLPGTQAVVSHNGVIGMSKEQVAQRTSDIQKSHGGNLTEEQVLKILMIESERHSYASYRAKKVGGRASVMGEQPALKGVVPTTNTSRVAPIDEIEDDLEEDLASKAIVEFKAIKVAVLENAGCVEIAVTRKGVLDETVTVKYVTRQGTAKPQSDYTHVEGMLTFQPNQQEQTFTVQIMDDVAYEEDEEFYVDLSEPTVLKSSICTAELGRTKTMTVVIIDDDLPGVLAFKGEQPNCDSVTVQEQPSDYEAMFTVIRKGGSTGAVSCSWTTEDDTAMAGINYEESKGVIEFESGETEKEIGVNIKARGRYDNAERFRIILTEVKGGAKFDPESDGGSESCILTVSIESNLESKKQVDRMVSRLQSHWEKSKRGHANWLDQFKNAFDVMGGEAEGEEDEVRTPGILDWIMHFVTMPWRLLFATVPPTDYCGGWICFVCSLGMIGLVTALISDLASLFGCICGLPDEITAITLVALGTSLPDTFASKSAAENDPDADASIGNVTGSNSVNVFLGLGLPWMIAAVYWYTVGPTDKWLEKYGQLADVPDIFKVPGKPSVFVVQAGALGFSVIMFSICAITGLAILTLRRLYCDGELGGPQPWKYLSSGVLVFLWFLYVGLSSWNTLSNK
eukprot:TRINITY_DN63246_c0_g1_i1.p1 TRINITY_DN63246_c0_g1~~TRINITY_DN63246_c0_g1_i1.p1  ORF type:complete len:834 (-),score=153.05 TRINITY_DN63246_c0_g1_i1:50-2551(-)